jgi:GNAT superfamily N-acetyltransferase
MTLATENYSITRYHEAYNLDVIRLCGLFSQESLNEYGLGVTPERLEQMIQVCKEISFFLVIDGHVSGLIAGFKVNNLTNGKLALQEVIWYVEKEYRSKGRVLLEYFEDAARTMGASQVVMALMCNSKSEQLGRFYERMGYKPFEIQYIKEII